MNKAKTISEVLFDLFYLEFLSLLQFCKYQVLKTLMLIILTLPSLRAVSVTYRSFISVCMSQEAQIQTPG